MRQQLAAIVSGDEVELRENPLADSTRSMFEDVPELKDEVFFEADIDLDDEKLPAQIRALVQCGILSEKAAGLIVSTAPNLCDPAERNNPLWYHRLFMRVYIKCKSQLEAQKVLLAIDQGCAPRIYLYSHGEAIDCCSWRHEYVAIIHGDWVSDVVEYLENGGSYLEYDWVGKQYGYYGSKLFFGALPYLRDKIFLQTYGPQVVCEEIGSVLVKEGLISQKARDRFRELKPEHVDVCIVFETEQAATRALEVAFSEAHCIDMYVYSKRKCIAKEDS